MTGTNVVFSGLACISQVVSLSQPGIVISAAVAQTGAMRVEGKARQNGNVDVGGVDHASRKLGRHGLKRPRRLVQAMGKRLWIGQLGIIYLHECQLVTTQGDGQGNNAGGVLGDAGCFGCGRDLRKLWLDQALFAAIKQLVLTGT